MAVEEPKIKIPDPLLDAIKLFKFEVGEVKKTFSFLITFVVGVMLIGFLTLLFALGALIVDVWQYRSSVAKDNIFERSQNTLDRLQTLEERIAELQAEQINNRNSYFCAGK